VRSKRIQEESESSEQRNEDELNNACVCMRSSHPCAQVDYHNPLSFSAFS
jgi:hypothetical protein